MLTLRIKKKWYDMILSGKKKEEYRDIKPYYDARIMNAFGAIWVNNKLVSGLFEEFRKEIPVKVLFINGYHKDAPRFIADCTMDVGVGKEEWGAEPGKRYYILKIENIYQED